MREDFCNFSINEVRYVCRDVRPIFVVRSPRPRTAGSGERKKKKLSCVTNAGFVISFFGGPTRAIRSKWISYLGRFRVTDTISLEAVTAFYCPYVEGAN